MDPKWTIQKSAARNQASGAHVIAFESVVIIRLTHIHASCQKSNMEKHSNPPNKVNKSETCSP